MPLWYQVETMKRVIRTKSKTPARDALSRAVVLLTLLAFTFQGYLTQAHIHWLSAGAPVVADVFDGAPSPAKDKAPLKNDPANCPLCQQIAGAGQFVTPAAAAILLPSLSISVIEVVAAAAHFVAPASHSWRGRAPPLG